MNSTASPPLLSVIVRTMGRPALARAVASIGAQSHRPLELVLVEASGREGCMAAPPGIPLRRVCEGPLARAAAANAGLRAASGQWLVFLDEDDEMAPGHLESLLGTAEANGCRVAYSQTRLVEPSGRVLRVFGGGPFNREALMRSNYLSIGAVLFHRSLLDEGARFDESLAVFEDWDFWLQLSSRADFAFSARDTAIYYAQDGASGAGAGTNLDRAAVLAQRERLMRKWLPARP